MVTTTKYFFQDKYGVPIITAPFHITVMKMSKLQSLRVGEWTPTERFMMDPSFKMDTPLRILRVGMYLLKLLPLHRNCSQYNFAGVVLAKPWAWIENDKNPVDPQYLDSSKGPTMGLKGFCIDVLKILAKNMTFNYKIVPSTGNQGRFDGPNILIQMKIKT